GSSSGPQRVGRGHHLPFSGRGVRRRADGRPRLRAGASAAGRRPLRLLVARDEAPPPGCAPGAPQRTDGRAPPRRPPPGRPARRSGRPARAGTPGPPPPRVARLAAVRPGPANTPSPPGGDEALVAAQA